MAEADPSWITQEQEKFIWTQKKCQTCKEMQKHNST